MNSTNGSGPTVPWSPGGSIKNRSLLSCIAVYLMLPASLLGPTPFSANRDVPFLSLAHSFLVEVCASVGDTTLRGLSFQALASWCQTVCRCHYSRLQNGGNRLSQMGFWLCTICVLTIK
jgi:hypothetical protein